MKTDLRIRPPRASEIPEINLLIMRSKAHWDYDAEYLRGCEEVLKISKSYIESWPAFVAESTDGKILGFSSLVNKDGVPELDHLWIDSSQVRSGVGKEFFSFMLAKAKELQWLPLKIVSDANAEGFYHKMGAVSVGYEESRITKGLMLPMLQHAGEIMV